MKVLVEAKPPQLTGWHTCGNANVCVSVENKDSREEIGDFDMEDEWQNSRRDAEYGNGGYRGGRRRERHGGGDDSAINLRVTVVADNGNLCVFHKVMASGDPEPVGIPVNRICTISVSQTNGSTLVITSEGTVCVKETFEEAMEIYAAARPMYLPNEETVET